jgi:hypothetical protein
MKAAADLFLLKHMVNVKKYFQLLVLILATFKRLNDFI